jgi:hypothetical protein
MRWFILGLLLITPAKADEPTGTYWLHVYTGHWGHVFGMYADKAACEAAGKGYPKWVYRACVPVPAAVTKP